MTVIVSSGIAIGLFLLALIIGKKKKLPADKFLTVYLVFFVVQQISFYAEMDQAFQANPLLLFGKGLYLLSAPLFFYYVYTLTRDKPPAPLMFVLTLLPFMVYCVAFFYYYGWGFRQYEVTVQNGLLYFDGELSWVWTGFVILFLLTDPFYLVWFYKLLTGYQKKVMASLSSVERVNLGWLKILFYIWLVSALVLFPVTVFSLAPRGIPIALTSYLLQLANLVFIFIAGYYGFRQTTVFTDANGGQIQEPREKTATYEKSGLNREQATTYRRQLEELMGKQKPYLNGELTSAGLAATLGISVNHLSQVLNQEIGQNFFDFINRYRVEEVKKKMRDPQFSHYTLLAIALESGFNSKTSFNTVFKKFTGQTPSRYFESSKNSGVVGKNAGSNL